jgi:hypothetical protein
VQDSDADIGAQIGHMAEIYGNSTVTIVASRVDSVHDGFLGARLPIGAELQAPRAFVLPFRLPATLDNGSQLHATIVRSENLEEWSEALDHRGWTLQERILSPRILDFRRWRTVFEYRTVDDPHGRISSDGYSRLPVSSAYPSVAWDQFNVHTVTRHVYNDSTAPEFT